jgi:hypothetical protein
MMIEDNKIIFDSVEEFQMKIQQDGPLPDGKEIWVGDERIR